MNSGRLAILKDMLGNGRITADLNTGKVYNSKGKELGIKPNKRGYCRTGLYCKGHSSNYGIHEIIAVAGGMDILGLTVNHIDEIKSHNWFTNLEPMTLSDNIQYSKGVMKNRGNPYSIFSHIVDSPKLIKIWQEHHKTS
jgi:chemotaxis signal transduction protein